MLSLVHVTILIWLCIHVAIQRLIISNTRRPSLLLLKILTGKFLSLCVVLVLNHLIVNTPGWEPCSIATCIDKIRINRLHFGTNYFRGQCKFFLLCLCVWTNCMISYTNCWQRAFHDLMKYLYPSLHESDMPHHTKTHGKIIEHAKLVVEQVEKKLQVCSHICLNLVSTDITMDSTWIKCQWPLTHGPLSQWWPILLVTGPYINLSLENPHVWKLKMEQLSFSQIDGNHSGQNIGWVLLKAIKAYGLEEKYVASLVNYYLCWHNMFCLGRLVHGRQCYQQWYSYSCCWRGPWPQQWWVVAKRALYMVS